jgi:crotonobetainyl-CoA:carnitine CoA-transferase CaiB-like acyl-CoA transferase
VESLIERLSAAGVPCGRVRTIEEVLADAQLAARRMFFDIATSDGPVKMPGNPIRLSDLDSLPTTAPPALGQHTKEIRDRAAKRSSGR